MKEVELCPGDPKAAECMRQLQQVFSRQMCFKMFRYIDFYDRRFGLNLKVHIFCSLILVVKSPVR